MSTYVRRRKTNLSITNTMSVERNDLDDEYIARWIGRVENYDIPEVTENQSDNFVDKIVEEK